VSGNAGTVTTINGRVAAGSNVTLTGAGTAASPYVVSAEGGADETTATIITKLDGSGGKIGDSVIPDALSGVGVPDFNMAVGGAVGGFGNGTYADGGLSSGKASYYTGSHAIFWVPTGAGYWIFSPAGGGAVAMTSTSDVATPNLATGWVRSGTSVVVSGFEITSSTQPAAFLGQLYLDTSAGVWYRWTGAAWDEDAGEVTLTGSQTLSAKTLTDPIISGVRESVTNLGNSGGSKSLSITAATSQQMTMTAACDVTMPTITAGRSFLLHVIAGSDPAWIPTFNSTPSVNWGGAVPAMNTTPGARNIYSFHVSPDGTGWNGALSGSAGGLYAFEIDEDGHLILTYADGTPPDFTIDGDGHLIYTF
jgi:hypothetical protein